MTFEWWEIIAIAGYFFWAGINAEFNHNYTCNLKLSIIFGLIWPVMVLRGKPKSMPRYYRDGHYKKDLD